MVVDPAPVHEAFEGRLSIPYVTPTGVVDLRFRCIEHEKCEGHAKYLSLPNATPTLFNVRAFGIDSPYIAITEGEMDGIATELFCGIPAVGVPGVHMWAKYKYWRRCFEGYETVFIIPDGDKEGRGLANQISRDLSEGNPLVVKMPDGLDANRFLMEHGAQAMFDLMGVEDERDRDRGRHLVAV